MNQWSVLICTHSRTLVAADEIQSLGVQAYCPVTNHFTKPKNKSKPVEVTQAAFPGYLFCHPDFEDFEATTDLKFSHVRRLRLGEQYCLVDHNEIERLRGEDGTRRTTDELVRFSVGDFIHVVQGPLTGCEGTVISVRGSKCGLNIIGSTAKIYMPDFSLKLKAGAITTVQ